MAGPWSKMVDVALTEEEQLEMVSPCPPDIANAPKYPYGLCITLDEKTLEKLGLDDDPEVGDVIDLRAFATVTCVSRNESAGGDLRRRIELQIEKLAVEDEADEDMPGEDEDDE